MLSLGGLRAVPPGPCQLARHLLYISLMSLATSQTVQACITSVLPGVACIVQYSASHTAVGFYTDRALHCKTVRHPLSRRSQACRPCAYMAPLHCMFLLEFNEASMHILRFFCCVDIGVTIPCFEHTIGCFVLEPVCIMTAAAIFTPTPVILSTQSQVLLCCLTGDPQYDTCTLKGCLPSLLPGIHQPSWDCKLGIHTQGKLISRVLQLAILTAYCLCPAVSPW